MNNDDKIVIGWREWCSFPELNLGAIKAKIDTGAATSSLHAYNINPICIDGKYFIDFHIHPVQNRRDIVRVCRAPMVDRRVISDSGGHRELRFVVSSVLVIGSVTKTIEITLTNRSTMAYRMLVGRSALKDCFVVDSGRSFLLGKISKSLALKHYT